MLAVLSLAGCKGRDRVRVQTDEEAPKMATMLTMSDPRAAAQLVSGFYNLEQNAWRWTAGHFSVILRPPRNADQIGAILTVKLSVPQPVIEKVKTVTLSAAIHGNILAPETYTTPGEHTYTRDVPAAALHGDSAKVDFSLDRYLPAGAAESRELGLIVTTVGFEHK